MKTKSALLLCVVACALSPIASAQNESYGALPSRPYTKDFATRGIATTDRLQEDSVQVTCNQLGNAASRNVVQALEQAQLAAIKFPADGKLMGDWQNGEKIAQNGRGMMWSDKADSENGGNCYNCHQLSKAETSFGTIGPSLNQYGALRGNSAEIQKYTYSKIYNAKAFNLCSSMPRFGHVGALTEKQIKDLVALLLDPESPVNKK